MENDISIHQRNDFSRHEFSVEDDGDDPQYSLFLSNLKTYGSSYVLLDNEDTGLTKPLRYEECESDNRAEEVSEHLPGIDDDYAFFHNSLRIEGSYVFWQSANGLPVPFDDLELPNFQIDDGTSSKKQKSITSNDKSEEEKSSPCGSRRRTVSSKFRQQIMRILSKPYDKEEHKTLMQAITERKSQSQHIGFRFGRVRLNASKKLEKSLLDQHWCLKRKVKAADKDNLKQLNLLRGFFFWLQRLTRDGSFMPWKDDECLAMRPQAC